MMLYEPIQIGNVELKNRIVMAPMGDFLHLGGEVTQRQIDYYARRAKGGAALIVAGYAAIDPEQHALQLRVYDDRYINGLARLARAIQANGAKAGVQLHHPGRAICSGISGVQAVAPSAGPCWAYWEVLSEYARELTRGEIAAIIDEYAEAARRVKEAGFDVVELHGAHGYLIDQFLSPHSNKRTDEYGGDVIGRARFALEVVKAVRRKVGPGYPIIFRLSYDEYIDGGLKLDDAKVIAKLLADAGVDVLSVSGGHALSLHWQLPTMLMPRLIHFDAAAQIRRLINVPVMSAGKVRHPKEAERLLQEGKVDLVGFARALLADPDLPIKGLEGRYYEINRCIDCNLLCVYPPQNVTRGVTCLVNREVGREGTPEVRASRARKVLICGAGPAGFEAARVARLRGHDVTLWQEGDEFGGRWSWLIRGYIRSQLKLLTALGVKVELKSAITPAAIAQAGPEVVMVTPGAAPVVPDIPGMEQENVTTADEVLDKGREVGQRAVIVGGGNYGCETAFFLHTHRQGAELTIIEPGPGIGYGLSPYYKPTVVERLAKAGVSILTDTALVRVEGGSVFVRDREGREGSLAADTVIVALGSHTDDGLLDSLRGKVNELIALPYCDQPRHVIVAITEAAHLARQI